MYLYPILVCCIQVKKSPPTRGKPFFSPLKELKIKKKNRKAWSLQEDTALVQFVALHKDMQPTNVEWPAMKPKHEYWTESPCKSILMKMCFRAPNFSCKSNLIHMLNLKSDLVSIDFFREFAKRMDKDLPFYYWTVNERFQDEELPSFDECPSLMMSTSMQGIIP